MLLSKLLLLTLIGCGDAKKQDTGTVDTADTQDTADTADTSDSAEVDEDGDGYDTSVDCDDTNPYAYPGAAENESASDCMSDRDEDGFGDSNPEDGVTAGTDCDDTEALTFPGSAENDSTTECMTDSDGDGYGSDAPATGVTAGTDCDDDDSGISPAAEEIADDGIDQNCDGEDEVTPLDEDGDGFTNDVDCDDNSVDTYPGAAFMDSLTDCMKDVDGDGYGSADVSGAVVAGTDCNDTAPTTNPGATEVPADGKDNNCDGLEACYMDLDNDGYGSSADTDGDGAIDTLPSVDLVCTGPLETDNTFDCDDSSASINPAATEIPNDGIDQDCDGQDLEQLVDADGDTYYSIESGGTDCNDNNASIHPGATEVANDGIDQDCNGVDLTGPQNLDGDAFYDTVDCDDNDPYTYPGAAENEVSYSLCMTDADRDGYGDDSPNSGVMSGTDCDDSLASVYPGATEIEDGIDNDCNGQIDDIASGGIDLDGDGYDNTVDCNDYDNDTHPGAAILENDPTLCMTDSDGDGYGDDNPATGVEAGTDCDDSDEDTNPGAGVLEADPTLCMTDADLDGYGDLNATGNVAAGTDCNDANGGVYPNAIEINDGIDNDCNGLVDDVSSTGTDADTDGFDDTVDCDDNDPTVFPGAAVNEDDPTICTVDSDGDGYGDSNPSNTNAVPGTDCDDSSASINPGVTENTSNGIDDNCDGQTDEAPVVDNDNDGYDSSEDCDDGDATINPGVDEDCSTIDRNCDGDATLGALDAMVWYLDVDGDTFGDAASFQVSCDQPTQYVTDDTDCDDSDALTFPGAAENDSTTACMSDADGDGYGDESATGAIAAGSDCDDSSSSINPDATENTSNGVDDNCDGQIDEVAAVDTDNDGYDSTVDCDDGDATINPAAAEDCSVVDRNCDGDATAGATDATTWYLDFDGDTFGDVNTSVAECSAPSNYVDNSDDCNDASATINPDAFDELGDGVDTNCDGEDGDVALLVDDLQYGDLIITEVMLSPAAATLANGQWFEVYNGAGEDVNLDGLVIKNASGASVTVTNVMAPPDSLLVFAVSNNLQQNGGLQFVTFAYGTQFPLSKTSAESIILETSTGTLIDRVDFSPTTFTYTNGVSISLNADLFATSSSVADENDNPANWCDATDTFGAGDSGSPGELNPACASSTVDGDNDGYDSSVDCDDADPSVNPGEDEDCDTVDRNCDGDATLGATDAIDWYLDSDNDGFGNPNELQSACDQPNQYVTDNTDCDDTDANINPDATENTTNNKDDNCDGQTDETPVVDNDGDGYNSTEDCDDNNAAINPETVWYIDNDGDGFGEDTSTQVSCAQPSGYALEEGDCNDSESSVNPGATEVAGDGVDQNCDSIELCYENLDGDAYPSAVEIESYNISCDGPGESLAATSSSEVDCDDMDPGQYPGAPELCNLEDDDCNGFSDDNVIGNDTYYEDADGDGFGDDTVSQEACGAPTGFVAIAGDCDDNPSTGVNINPAAEEDCDDTTDLNCDGDNTANAADASLWYADTDSDNYGAADAPLESCSQPSGYVSNNSDCDDGDNAINPTATEVCDNIDHNCDGDTESGALGASTWYEDADSDLFGNISSTASACSQPTGYVSDNTDCDDANASINPGAQEDATNGIDDNCNGTTDETTSGTDADNDGVTFEEGDCDDNDPNVGKTDVDGDGYSACGNIDCDDNSATTFPGAAELESDANCMKDDDGDGYGDDNPARPGVIAGTDCDDVQSNVSPIANDIPGNGVDEDCDGSDATISDNDNDGYDSTVDCDDNNPNANPGVAFDIPQNGVDEDCDGSDSSENFLTASQLVAGDLYISEVMVDPSIVADTQGEWFEVINASGEIVYLDGVVFYDNSGESFTLTDLWVQAPSSQTSPGAFILGINGDAGSNGGIDVDFVYSGFTLNNTADAINIKVGSTVIETFSYDSTYNVSAGASLSLDMDQLSDPTAGAAENNTSTLWCSSSVLMGGGDYGTPGVWNDSCISTAVDADGDTFYNNVDCDDSDPLTYPGAAENDSTTECMTDADGDGYGDDSATGSIAVGTDCDDSDATYNPASVDVLKDCDDTNDSNSSNYGTSGIDNDGDLYQDDVDCDDGNANAFPGAAELDSTTDCMLDADGDGYGDETANGSIVPGTDCDDTSVNTFPGAAENDSLTACMLDADGDGYGYNVGNAGILAGSDCNDADANIYTGATEDTTNGVDDNCNGQIDEEAEVSDADGDGFTIEQGDCDDNDPNVTILDEDGDGFSACSEIDCDDDAGTGANTYPGAAFKESTTACMTDKDGDGYGDDNPSKIGITAGTDCNDNSAQVSPDGTDTPGNGLDEDCDGSDATVQDADGDGYDNSVDCDDNDASANPGVAFDIPQNNIDENCDGSDSSENYLIATDLDFGDLFISEVMVDPAAVADNQGEWFEVFNGSGEILYLDGVEFYDNSGESFVLYDVWVDVGTTKTYPGAFVLGNNADESTNGGVEISFEYTGFTLDNTADAINIRVGSTVIDTFSYDSTFNVTSGASIGADLDLMSDQTAGAAENDDASIWCSSSLAIPNGAGDYGTPGVWNDSCTSANLDADGDGYYDNVDCDDSDAFTYPGAAENESETLCMTDADGDGYGAIDVDTSLYIGAGSDCDDSDATINPASTDVLKDCDDTNDSSNTDYGSSGIDNDGDLYQDDVDCDDGNANAFPGAAELDSTTDCMLDVDGDGYGDETASGTIVPGTDCDDTSVDTFPGAAEKDSTTACMLDEDGDGYGHNVGNAGIQAGSDCDDTDANINFAATEDTTNGVDDNCNGQVDEDGSLSSTDEDNDGVSLEEGDCDDNDPNVGKTDDDGDGYSACGNIDCDDNANTGANTYPGAAELDSEFDCMKDDDNDGYGDLNPSKTAVTAGTDCNDNSNQTNPDATDIPGNNTDEDCDGSDTPLVDGDNDGYYNDVDCDDTDPNVNPGVTFDIPNDGIDQDCADGDNTAAYLDVDSLAVGDLVITELMVQPSVVSDQNGEWFEIYNVSGFDVLLDGVTFKDAGTDAFVVSGSVFIPADRSMVLGRSEDTNINGDLEVDYAYGTSMTFDNNADELMIEATAGILDSFSYDNVNYDISAGYALQLDMDLFSSIADVKTNGSTLNDTASNWCVADATATYGLGDVGTPNEINATPTAWYVNPACGVALTDDDNDGFTSFEDCDDSNANVFPGSAELDSLTDCMEDADGDGYGAETPTSSFATAGQDCDDTSTTYTPASTDVLYDCDPSNDGSSTGTDADGDGWTVEAGDCDDNSPETFPGAAEAESSTDCMKDVDGDGYGDVGSTGDVSPGQDCDDADANINPGATEIQGNGIDEDCNPNNDSVADVDGDGVTSDVDCDDNNAIITTLKDEDGDSDGFACVIDCDDSDATLYPGNGINEPDTSLCVIDVDGDGFGESNPSNANADAGTDCDDGNDTINPDATDIPGDGFDQDCDGADAALQDADGDGYDNSADCNDNDNTIYPTAFDIPGDSIDQDCDGSDATGSISTVADLLPGDLVITEIMVDPAVVVDTDGEWFEILNTTGSIFNLNGLKIQDANMISNSTTYTINVDAYINSEDFAVFIRNTDASINGGIQNGINFGSVTLNNTGTETLRILGGASGTTTIDEFSWDAAQMNFIEGVSIMFDGDELANMTNLSDAANMNDDGDKWCHTVIPYGDGDNKGTPKNYNNSCTNIPVDNDGDGYYQNAIYQEDCDDSTTTNLGQTEVDGYYTYPGAAYRDSFTECMTDVDGDGYGDENPATNVTPGSDCDDGDNTTNPASTDVAKDCNPNTP